MGNRPVKEGNCSSRTLKSLEKHFSSSNLLIHHELAAHQVPGGLREPHIRGHYRKPNQKFTSYFGSIFEIHNECLNIWTALLSIASIMFWFSRHCMERNILYTPEAWPMTLVAGSMIVTHIASANAHTMGHHSVEISGVFYLFDYLGITIYLYNAALATFVYSVQLLERDLMNLALFLSLFNSVAWPWFCNRTLGKYKRSDELSQRPSLSKLIFVLNFINAFTIFCGVVIRMRDVGTNFDTTCKWYVLWFLASVADLTVYKLFIPESIAPGNWDIFNSHVIHHILALVSNMCHLEALECDWEMQMSDHEYSSEYLLVLSNVCTVVFIVALANFSVIFVLVENFFDYIQQIRKIR